MVFVLVLVFGKDRGGEENERRGRDWNLGELVDGAEEGSVSFCLDEMEEDGEMLGDGLIADDHAERLVEQLVVSRKEHVEQLEGHPPLLQTPNNTKQKRKESIKQGRVLLVIRG